MSEISERVAKLLAMANDGGVTEREAESFLAKAAELMARENIDASLLASKAKVFLKPTIEIFYVVPSFVVQKTSLLHVIATAFKCEIITPYEKKASRNGGIAEVDVFGFQNDIDSVTLLYSSAVVLGESGSARRAAAGNTSKSYQTSYWAGFAVGIGKQLKESTRTAETAAVKVDAGVSLVLRDKSLAVKQLMREKYPRITTTKRIVSNYAGFNAGTADGKNANLFGRSNVPAAGTKAIVSGK